MTPIGAWVYAAHEAVMADAHCQDHPTTCLVLRFFLQLHTVFIQDTMAMAILYPAQKDHAIYHEFPMFFSN